MSSQRAQRIQALKQAVDDYVTKETTRIDNEVSVLQDILNGRTGGRGVQQNNTDVVSAVAFDDLAAYLSS